MDVSPVPHVESAVSLRGVSRRYREGERTRAVLVDLDLEVRRGECVALLGRSGSGKSTLLNLISGIDLPDSGTVCVNGVDLTALSERDRTLFRRRHVGFVYQFFNLIPTLTVVENVSLPLQLNGYTDAQAHTVASARLAEVGLGERADSFPDLLSGGEQQRVAIARALAHSPALILADEPTGNLDAVTGEHVLGLLDAMTRRAGHTLLLVTHSRAVAERADRVLVLAEGRVTDQSAAAAW